MEGVLSKGGLSGNGLCVEGVMYGGGFVRGGFVRGGFVQGGFVRRGFCPRTINTTSTYTITADNLFHSFTVLYENGNFLISSLHCFFANVIPCPLVLLSSLTQRKKYFCQYFHTHSIF